MSPNKLGKKFLVYIFSSHNYIVIHPSFLALSVIVENSEAKLILHCLSLNCLLFFFHFLLSVLGLCIVSNYVSDFPAQAEPFWFAVSNLLQIVILLF